MDREDSVENVRVLLNCDTFPLLLPRISFECELTHAPLRVTRVFESRVQSNESFAKLPITKYAHSLRSICRRRF